MMYKQKKISPLCTFTFFYLKLKRIELELVLPLTHLDLCMNASKCWCAQDILGKVNLLMALMSIQIDKLIYLDNVCSQLYLNCRFL